VSESSKVGYQIAVLSGRSRLLEVLGKVIWVNPTLEARAEVQIESRIANSKCVHFMGFAPIEVIGANMR